MISRPDYAALFAASPYPYLLIDTGFVIIGANPAYLRATGRNAKDLIGKPIFEAFPANPSDPDSTNLEEVRASIELAISTRKPHTSALLRYAIPRDTKDGIVFDERYWSAIHTPVFDAGGRVQFVAQNAIDVTELYWFDARARKYYLREEVHAVGDLRHQDRSQMHEAMSRILSSERSQMQILFDQAPGFIAVLNGPDHTFEMVNDAYYCLVGYRDLLGKPAMTAMPELANQGFKELLDHVFATGEALVLNEQRVLLQRIPEMPPEERYVDLVYQPIHSNDGRVSGIFAQGNDVSRAYEANRALAEKLEQLEEIRLSQAFQLQLADRIRLLLSADEVTEAACELLGQALDASRVLYAEVSEQQDTLHIRRDWTAPGIRSLAGQILAMRDFGPALLAQLRFGDVVPNDDVSHDPRTAEHTHAYRQIGVAADLLLPLVRDGSVKVVLAIQSATPRSWESKDIRVAQDMAERMWSAVEAAQAQAALRVQRDESQYIFDSMAEGFAVLDGNWTILRMNAEGLRLTRRSAEQVIGRNHWNVFPELQGTEIEKMYRRVIETGKTEAIELDYSEPAGPQAWVEVRAHPSRHGGIAFFFREVTERRLAQEASQLADQRKDEFLAMLAHELRNPLAPIGAAAQVLQIARLDEARVRQTSQVIGRQVKHMTHLIDDLLDVSRVTRGLVTIDDAPQDIRQIVAEAVEQVTPLIQSRKHHLTLCLPPNTTIVKGDAKRLVQVITNILNNAAKYTNEGGSILLDTEVRESHVLVRVTDNGLGMSPDLAARAFELFAQAERASDRSAGGLGLGLALVKSLVELHGGTVSCASEGLGKGSTFTICLPRVRLLDESTRQDHGAALPIAERRSLNILLVDDNVDAAAMLAMVLDTYGYRITVEHRARAALERASEIQPEVCLLDIGLPEMDGIELAQRLRNFPATSNALLIAVTGYGQDSDRQQTLAAGFNYHFVKPLDIPKLCSLLQEYELGR
jgi:PAS domain S-box-containing protein